MGRPLASRQAAAVLVILAAVLWWHRWVPALILVAFVAWVAVHKRFESGRGWPRLWPHATIVIVALVAGGTAMYWTSSAAVEAKVLPVALNLLAGLMVARDAWSRLTASPRPPLSGDGP